MVSRYKGLSSTYTLNAYPKDFSFLCVILLLGWISSSLFCSPLGHLSDLQFYHDLYLDPFDRDENSLSLLIGENLFSLNITAVDSIIEWTICNYFVL